MWLKIALLGGEKLSSEAGTQREFPDLNWPSPFNESIIFKRLENIKGCIRCNKMVGERNKCLKKGSFICRLGHSLNTGYESGRSSLVAASYSSRPLQKGLAIYRVDAQLLSAFTWENTSKTSKSYKSNKRTRVGHRSVSLASNQTNRHRKICTAKWEEELAHRSRGRQFINTCWFVSLEPLEASNKSIRSIQMQAGGMTIICVYGTCSAAAGLQPDLLGSVGVYKRLEHLLQPNFLSLVCWVVL